MSKERKIDDSELANISGGDGVIGHVDQGQDIGDDPGGAGFEPPASSSGGGGGSNKDDLTGEGGTPPGGASNVG